jgi:trk system potassium uptake protein TrkA
MAKKSGKTHKIVIVGAGNIDLALSRLLIDEGHDVVLIEKDPKKAKMAFTQLDCLVINDEGNRPEVLREAGVDDADFFISVTDSDELNMISCGLVAEEFHVPVKIARVRNVYYSTSHILQRHSLGINFIVNPDVEAAEDIVRVVKYGAMGDIIVFERGSLQMRKVIINPGSELINRSIREIRQGFPREFLVVAIIRDDDYIIPSGNTQIQENDNLYILTTQQAFDRIFEMSGKLRKKIRKIVVVGGGSLVYPGQLPS